MRILEDNIKWVGGVDLFERIIDVGLRGPRAVSFWIMHSQGFGGITFE